MLKIQLATKPLSEVKADYLVLPVFEGEKNLYNHSQVIDFLAENPKFGKLFESQIFFSKNQKVVLLGIGKKKELDFIKVQNWVGTAVKFLSSKAKQISILLPQSDNLTVFELGRAATIGAEIAIFNPAKAFKSEFEAVKLNSVELVVSKADRGYQDGLKRGQIEAEAINLVRELGDMPSNIMTPTYFLNIAKKVARENERSFPSGKLKLTVLTEAQAKRLGMGAFVGVAQGSDEPSFMIVLEYRGDIKSKEKWAIVGKGITFDSGGLSIKPSNSMHEMKYDMCGAATALATIQVLSKLGVKENILAVMPVTENLVNGRAQRPGDIVKTYCGKYAEVLNTDAEGRLVLIDAVAYAQKDFKATKVIDLATLTGAMVVALGDFYTGVFGNNKEFTNKFIEVALKNGEKMWELPMDDEFNEMIKSEMADITNIGHGGSHPSSAGSITAAKFIEAGISPGVDWIHLDIAGTAWDMKPKSFRAAGASGVGLKTLVSLIKGDK